MSTSAGIVAIVLAWGATASGAWTIAYCVCASTGAGNAASVVAGLAAAGLVTFAWWRLLRR